jgi:hypothetical protein
MTTLSPNGILTRSPLFESKDFETLFTPDKSTPINANKLFFVASRQRFFHETLFRIGIITLPKNKE